MSEYMLNRNRFELLQAKWGPFGLDACAASWNHQLPRYLSRQQGDTDACGHDVLSFPLQWEKEVVYAFPPMHKRLIMELLQRVRAAQVEMVLIIPVWDSMELAAAVKMLVDVPVVMECEEELLLPPHAYQVHLRHKIPQRWWNQRKWKALLGMRLSGNAARAEGFATQWRATAEQCTKKDEMATTLIDHSRSLWPVSESCMETSRLLCRMLSSGI